VLGTHFLEQHRGPRSEWRAEAGWSSHHFPGPENKTTSQCARPNRISVRRCSPARSASTPGEHRCWWEESTCGPASDVKSQILPLSNLAPKWASVTRGAADEDLGIILGAAARSEIRDLPGSRRKKWNIFVRISPPRLWVPGPSSPFPYRVNFFETAHPVKLRNRGRSFTGKRTGGLLGRISRVRLVWLLDEMLGHLLPDRFCVGTYSCLERCSAHLSPRCSTARGRACSVFHLVFDLLSRVSSPRCRPPAIWGRHPFYVSLLLADWE